VTAEPDYLRTDTLTRLAGDWIPLGGTVAVLDDYDSVDEAMLRLYVQGKQRQWDADELLTYDHTPDPENPTGIPDEFISIAGSPVWAKMSEASRGEARRHAAGWLYSQFLHSEQFALVGVGKVCAGAESMEAKMFAATQLMDEARHVEAFNNYIKKHVIIRYDFSPTLRSLLEGVLSESRWDFGVLVGHVMVENMALATHAQHRTAMGDPLARALSAYVARDEARHVAFGRLLLRSYYPQLTQAELREREEFVLEACWALREKYVDDAIWIDLGLGEEVLEAAKRSPVRREFRRKLFMRLVPGLKEVGLLGDRLKEGMAGLGVLGFADYDDRALLSRDEDSVDELTRRELAERTAEIDRTVQLGAGAAAEDGS
jgi:hypothetical protein